MKQLLPALLFAAVAGSHGSAQAQPTNGIAASAFGVELQNLDMQDSKDIENAFREATKGRAGAVLLLANPVIFSQRTQAVDLAAKSRLPAMYWSSKFVEGGGLMTYSVSVIELFRRAADYVDKIFKGVKPGDIPVEQPRAFEFLVNLKTAKQIGLTIPANVLARADRVIK